MFFCIFPTLIRPSLFLFVFALIQGALSSGVDFQTAFCKNLELLANHFNLLSAKDAPGMEALESLSFEPALPCGLDWNTKRLIQKHFNTVIPSDERDDLFALGHEEDVALSGAHIKGRMMLVPEAIARDCAKIKAFIVFNGYILELVGGIFEQYDESIVFTFDAWGKKAYELRPDDQNREELTVQDIMTSYEDIVSSGELGHNQLWITGLHRQLPKDQGLGRVETRKKRKRTLDVENQMTIQHLEEQQEALRQQTLDIRSQLIASKEQLQEKAREELNRQMQVLSNQQVIIRRQLSALKQEDVSFTALLYRALEPIDRVSELPNIPLEEAYLPIEIPLPETVTNAGLMQGFFRHQSIRLVRLIQLTRHFTTTFPELKITFKDQDIKNIIRFMDEFTKAPKEIYKDLVEELLLKTLKIMFEPDFLPSYYGALLRREQEFKRIFLTPGPNEDMFYQFESSFDFKSHIFDDSALGQLLAYEINDQPAPLNLVLNVKGHQNAEFVPFAFLGNLDSFLCFLKRVDNRYMAVKIYGCNAEDEIKRLDLGSGGDDDFPLEMAGKGIVFYHYQASHHLRTKVAAPEADN